MYTLNRFKETASALNDIAVAPASKATGDMESVRRSLDDRKELGLVRVRGEYNMDWKGLETCNWLFGDGDSTKIATPEMDPLPLHLIRRLLVIRERAAGIWVTSCVKELVVVVCKKQE
jgi:hypothetical protein